MDRKEFLYLVGTGVGAITIGACLGSCKKSSSTPAAATVDFTLNLNDAANAALKNNGGYLYNQGVIIARTLTGTYIAVSQYCTHQGVTVIYQGSANDFYCNAHGSSFSNSGAVTGGPASGSLKSYTATLSGTSLHVFG
jgi:cytochrome b6-f complex iron-sulfur subunit